MTVSVKHDGTWKTATPAVKHNGVWKTPLNVYVNHNGVWKLVYTAP